MMISSGATSCFPSASQASDDHMYIGPGGGGGVGAMDAASEAHLSSLLCSIPILKDKVHQVQSLVSMFLAPNQSQHPPGDSAVAAAATNMAALIQDIIVTASSMMFNSQHIALATSSNRSVDHVNVDNKLNLSSGLTSDPTERHELFPGDSFFWFGDDVNHNQNSETDGTWSRCMSASLPPQSMWDNPTTSNDTGNQASNCTSNFSNNKRGGSQGYNDHRNMREPKSQGEKQRRGQEFDQIIELDAKDILAKYTHYCQICGKGFKRDANLRMHMRAHGDEYKSRAALINPLKKSNVNGIDHTSEGSTEVSAVRKYSCPQEGCRWNRKHARFQPLKSMICVKNHYKRSHCPKMYMCKRCNRKQFSVLSDLRTHEKHCGELRWQCSCGTPFSRKDKLMGHVALFVGHTPMINPTSK